MTPICFYHSADLDGVCSGAIVKHFVPDCELVGYDYGQPFPWDKVRPGMDAENDPLWAHLYKPENGYVLEVIGDPPKAAIETLKYERRTVYMADVSLPPEDMKRLAEVSNLVWIDHHKSAIESLRGTLIAGLRDVKAAACELVWAWFMDYCEHPIPVGCREHSETAGDFVHRLRDGEPSLDGSGLINWDEIEWSDFHNGVPEAVRLLGRYDVWDKDNPEWESKIMPFQYGMRNMPGAYNPDSILWQIQVLQGPVWDGGPGGPPFDCQKRIDEGFAILRYQAEVNRRAMETGAHEFVWTMPDPELQPRVIKDTQGNDALLIPSGMKFKFVDGKCERVPNNVMPSYRVLACNTIVFNSQFFEGFFDPEKHDVMCAYCQLANGKWKVSLYSTKPEIDCGAICKTFGGGGHVGAAGFICDKLPWEN